MNKPLQQALWEKIQNFPFDDPTSGFPFSKKLQQENNWSAAFTRHAIEEYRKFIFLCCILPEGASPSETIDTVWHLHLTYTTNYWVEFCEKTLHKDIHHFPSKGGNEESAKHRKWYQQTLKHYEGIFGVKPPASIWPIIAVPPKPISIDIYEKLFYKKVLTGFLLFSLGLVIITHMFSSAGKDFLVYYCLLMIAGIGVSWLLQQHKSARIKNYVDHEFPTKFSLYQVANFLYGRHRAYQTALVDLLKEGLIEVEGNRYKLTLTAVPGAKTGNPLLPSLTEFVSPGQSFSYREGLALLDIDKLKHDSFDHLSRVSKLTDLQKLAVPGIVLLVGFARLFQGMANAKPVSLLVLEIGVFSLIALMIASRFSYIQLVYKQAETIWKQQTNKGHSNDVLHNFTILGAAAIKGLAEYSILSSVFAVEGRQQKWGSDGGLAATGGCSNGGDGGGCGGGCGGCGGGN